MNAPFAASEFFGVFARYNQAIWPAQFGLIALALALLAVAVRGGRNCALVVYGGLALLWAWCGAVYHLAFFTRLNPLAWAFGALFLLQAGAFAVQALRAGEPTALRWDARGILGTTLVLYALVAYPLIGLALGQGYPAAPSFGVPCPLVIYTFGMLLLATGRVPVHLLVIPVLWALLAGPMAVRLWGVFEDLGLPLAAVLGAIAVLIHNRRIRAAEPAGHPGRVGETPAQPEGIRRLH